MTSTGRKTSAISVIIPARNEAAHIGPTIDRAYAGGAAEVIVVDGRSTDSTVSLSRAQGATVISSPPGRARQMNAGAAAATNDILLFCHADTLLPDNFATAVQRGLACGRAQAGAFHLRIDRKGFALRCIEAGVALRTKMFSLPYGDQAIFVRRELFVGLGGYAEVPILEDLLLVKSLRKRGAMTILPEAVLTSGRRWQQLGPLRTTLRNQAILAGFLLGVSLQRLQDWYRIGKKM